MKKLTKARKKKFLNNALRFTAPALGIFFAQLALQVPVREASMVALLAGYGLASDYFNKMK